MWTRRDLKSRAKSILRKSYWRALIVSFIIVIAGGSFISNSSRGSSSSYSNNYTRSFKNEQRRLKDELKSIKNELKNNKWVRNNSASSYIDRAALALDSSESWPISSNNWSSSLPFPFSLILFALAGLVSLIIGLLVVAFRVLVGYNLEVGGRRYFLMAAQGNENLSNAFNNIKSRYYVNVLSTMFLRSLYTFLWSLLFVIPGIIKSYSYRMVPYILAENPDMVPSEAIAKSISMTDGHKMNMFILDLSFIGWYILGAFAFGIGKFFVNPYVESTYAQLYLTLSNKGDSVDYDYVDVRQGN